MKIILFITFIIVSSFAIDIDDIDSGDVYYINGGLLNDDRRVMVIRVSHSKGKVKVRADNGDTEWVYPSKLLTRNENDVQNFAMPFALIGGLAAAASENSDKDKYGGYKIKAKNNCPVTMRLAIVYLPSNSDEWESEYWWELKPDEKSSLLSNGSELYTKNQNLYYYAIGKYNSSYEIDGFDKYYINGKKYWFKELVDKTGTTDIILNCK